MPTPLIDYPRPILDFEVKPYTQKQDLVTNPDRFRGFPAFGIKSYGNPGLFVGTIRHLSTSERPIFYRAGIVENDIKFQFLEFLVEAGLPM